MFPGDYCGFDTNEMSEIQMQFYKNVAEDKAVQEVLAWEKVRKLPVQKTDALFGNVSSGLLEIDYLRTAKICYTASRGGKHFQLLLSKINSPEIHWKNI